MSIKRGEAANVIQARLDKGADGGMLNGTRQSDEKAMLSLTLLCSYCIDCA